MKDLCSIDPETLLVTKGTPATTRRITTRKLHLLKNLAVEKAHPGSCPHHVVDYHSFENLYKAWYGPVWEEKIKKATALAKYVCVKDLVLHIDKESRRAFAGTRYENDYLFYHDALTQLTDSQCVEWMKSVGIYDRWLKPELGCNDVVRVLGEDGLMQDSTRFKGRFVGNSPELNPLDNSLFRDLRTSLNLHVAATWNMEKSDTLKFSLGTPKEITRAFLRIWDPTNGVAPPSKRILEDVKKILTSLEAIVEANGKIVPGLVNRNGHRAGTKSTDESTYVKTGKKTCLSEIGIHDSIRGYLLDRYREEKKKYLLGENESHNVENNENDSHEEDMRAID